MILVVSDHELHAVDVPENLRVLGKLVKVSAQLTAAENPDRASECGGVVASIFECFPRRFQEQTMLGIGEGRVPRREPEELGVEAVHIS